MIPKEQLLATGEFLLSEKRVRFLAHKRPDGDTIGSCLALARFLTKRGVDAGVFAPFERSDKFDFMAGFDELFDGREEVGDAAFADTLYVVTDSTSIDRTGFEPGDFQRVLRIDHHIGGDHYLPLDLVDTDYGATTLIVCDLLRALDEDAIDEEIATNLYTGLMTDTGGFRYASTDAHAFRSAAFMVDRGAEPSAIATLIYDRNSAIHLELMRRALESLQFHSDGRVALLCLKPTGLAEADLPFFEDYDFINLPRSLAGVEVVVQMKLSLEGDWKVGFRGKGRVNVQAVAVTFGGGGHFSASGCEMLGEEDEIRSQVLARVEAALCEADAVPGA
jgi:phosphoesterase RecJ-like protein